MFIGLESYHCHKLIDSLTYALIDLSVILKDANSKYIDVVHTVVDVKVDVEEAMLRDS